MGYYICKNSPVYSQLYTGIWCMDLEKTDSKNEQSFLSLLDMGYIPKSIR